MGMEPCGSGVLASLRMLLSSTFRASGWLLVALLALSCGGDDDPGGGRADLGLDPQEEVRLERAMTTLETASKRVRGEVLRTCDKWRHIDRPCVENEIRREQLDCWLSVGLARWDAAQRKGMGPFGGDRAVMRVQNSCLEKRRWRKIERSPF